MAKVVKIAKVAKVALGQHKEVYINKLADLANST